MSYVQGTRVRLTARFTNEETGVVVTPDEVILTVEDGAGTITVHALTDDVDPVQQDVDADGAFFYYVLDTATIYGTWSYEFSSTDAGAVVERKNLTIRKRIAA